MCVCCILIAYFGIYIHFPRVGQLATIIVQIFHGICNSYFISIPITNTSVFHYVDWDIVWSSMTCSYLKEEVFRNVNLFEYLFLWPVMSSFSKDMFEDVHWFGWLKPRWNHAFAQSCLTKLYMLFIFSVHIRWHNLNILILLYVVSILKYYI